MDDPDPSSPNDHSNDLAQDIRSNDNGEDNASRATACSVENSQDTDDPVDAPLWYFFSTTVDANSVSVRRSFINGVQQRRKLRSSSSPHLLRADESFLRSRFHATPVVTGHLDSPSLSRLFTQDTRETRIIQTKHLHQET